MIKALVIKLFCLLIKPEINSPFFAIPSFPKLFQLYHIYLIFQQPNYSTFSKISHTIGACG